jgi:hypothetical protein
MALPATPFTVSVIDGVGVAAIGAAAIGVGVTTGLGVTAGLVGLLISDTIGVLTGVGGTA